MSASARRMLREPQCFAATGLSRWQRLRLEALGLFPRRIRIGCRAVAWFEDEVADWQETLARGETWHVSRAPSRDRG